VSPNDRGRRLASLDALWPAPGQELLLRAALGHGRQAIAAWDEWKKSHDLVESLLDHGSFRLLPLVYRNLLASGADDPLMPRLKGIYRYWWCANQRLFDQAAAATEGLEKAGIPTLVLKGAAISILHYRDRGVRPMGDADVLVPHDRAAAAVECFRRMGWRPARARVGDLIRYQHSVRMVSPTGEGLDLHWRGLAECVGEGMDDAFWSRAVPLRLLLVDSRGLAPGDALLHAVVHGMRWNAEPPIRWITDAMVILREAGHAIDWPRVADEARARGVALRLAAGLTYLRARFDAPIPEEALASLWATQPALVERLELDVLTIGARGAGRLGPGHLLLLLVQYLRFTSGKGVRRVLAETPAYVRYRLRGRPGRMFDAARGVRRGWRRLSEPAMLSHEQH
jgi:hypothetical protein